MIEAKGFAALAPKEKLVPYSFHRRDIRANDVQIKIEYCGVCHSDIHQVREEWGPALFPMVPGHEIVGRVTAVGAAVTQFKVGDLAGVGCMVDSCLACPSCDDGLEQYCENGFVGTYNAIEKDGKTPTHGGYSNAIVVREEFCLKVSPNLPLAGVAPLLCAGITTYSPLRHWQVRQGQRVGVVGLGGLGHMAVKLAKAMGAFVTVFTTSPSKVEDALKLKADEVVISKDLEAMAAQKNRYDFILDTVSAPHDYNLYLNLLKRDGQMVLVGLPDRPAELPAGALIMGRRRLGGSLIGGVAETQEMLDFCAEKGIVADIELIPIHKINEAYERMIKSDVKYRFVIDMNSLDSI